MYDLEHACVPGRNGGLRAAWLVLGGLLAVGALIAVLALSGGGSGGSAVVNASVVAADGGEAMLFEVPGAPAGSKIRFGGLEKELTAGRVTFPLAEDSLRVGDNAVLVDVLKPGGDIESARIKLAVDYRIRVDTSPLQAGESKVDVVVSALPGSQVKLDGEEVALDAEGRAVKSYPLDVVRESKLGTIEHVVRYRITPPSGEAAVDELRTKIAVTLMQIDRPGLESITDKETIDIAGAVTKGTKVTIDGVEVEVKEGRFLKPYPLPGPKVYEPKVMAAAPGKVPLSMTLRIERVEDLAKAAAGFDADASLTYAKISQNPAIYKGQKVAFDGRVYNVRVEGGVSVLQMLVRKCPKGRSCSLWVTYPAATDVSSESWVRVLGTLDGVQQFRSEQDEVVTVPKLKATFLLPARL